MSSEQDLIKKAQKGDKDARSVLAERYAETVFKIALKIVRRVEDAKDVTQDVIVNIFRSISTLRRVSKIDRWVYKIAKNTSLNWLRSMGRLLVLPHEDIAEKKLTEMDAQKHLEEKEALTNLQTALEKLPLQYREIIDMYYFKGRSYDEISKDLNIPIGTVKTHLFRAKDLLKELISE